jgi:lipopolysaccharide/colanic/teichoic acid biosynthesis glycosyltransferase
MTARTYPTKRLFDLACVVLAAVPATVIGTVIAIAIKATSRGPVFFRQERVGRHGVPFTIIKFRTMVTGDNPIFPDATRVTRIGALLRSTSLDEIPELINVAKGEMSIVGPRPTLAYQVARYTPEQRRRLDVRPGVTGLAQVSGRNAMLWSDRIVLDLEYIERQGLVFDTWIVIRSALAVLRRSGVEGHPVDDPISRLD